ncbi:MAG: hypothetical protein ABJA83_15375 [Burkholderiaceae bacterium]
MLDDDGNAVGRWEPKVDAELLRKGLQAMLKMDFAMAACTILGARSRSAAFLRLYAVAEVFSVADLVDINLSFVAYARVERLSELGQPFNCSATVSAMFGTCSCESLSAAQIAAIRSHT